MKKTVTITSIIICLGLVAIGFQNCGEATQFNEDEVSSRKLLIITVDENPSAIATLEQEEIVLQQMAEFMNEDPLLSKTPLSEMIEVSEDTETQQTVESTEKATLREDIMIFECKNKEGYSTYPRKYMICHVPLEKPNNTKVLCLTKPEFKAHLTYLNGEAPLSYMGPCKINK